MFAERGLLLVIIILFAGWLAYKSSLMHKKWLWQLSWLQILYLVVFPGFLFVIFFSYIQDITRRPMAENIFLSDGLLINIILLSTLFAYGGKAVHAVTKMLSETALRADKTKVGELNKYFHLKFSHNLMYAGSAAAVLGLTLLELNHVPQNGYDGWLAPIFRGIALGLLVIVSMLSYTSSKDSYVGRWADLKSVFMTIWLGFVVLLYVVRKFDPRLTDYQLLLPALFGFVLLLVLNFVLVFRRFKRTGNLKKALRSCLKRSKKFLFGYFSSLRRYSSLK